MSKRNPVGGRCERSPKITIESRRDTRRLHIQYPHDLRDALRPEKAAAKREEERIRLHPGMAKHASPQVRRKLKIAKLDRLAAANSGATPGEREAARVMAAKLRASS